MGALKFGLTLGLIGAVAGVFNLANDIPYLKALAAPGWYVAAIFGKTCIGPFIAECSAKELGATIVAVSVGNGVVYAIAGALIGWGFKSLFSSKSSNAGDSEQKTQVVQIIQPIIQQPAQKVVTQKKEEKRPQTRAVVSTKISKK